MYIIHGKPNCPYCHRAVELLKKTDDKMVYIDITLKENEHIVQELAELGCTTVPQIYFNDEHIGGYEDLVIYLRPRQTISGRTVVKRKGHEEPFSATKINDMAEWAVLGNPNVQWSEVVMDAMGKLEGSQLTSANIQEALIQTCLEKDSESHNKVAGRLLLGTLRKVIVNSRHDFAGFYTKMVANGYWKDMGMSTTDLSNLTLALDHRRDLSYGYPTLRQFKDKYCLKDEEGNLLEHPQFLYMGIAMERFKDYGLKEIVAYYDAISTHKINLPSPQLSTDRKSVV